MNSSFKRLTSVLLVFQLFLNSAPVYADLLDRDAIRQEIIQNATHGQETPQAPTATEAPASPTPSVSTDVTNTGDKTTVNDSTNSTADTVVKNTNDTQVDQTINAEANTGRNQANGNISIGGSGAGNITTGDATVNASGSVNAGENTNAVGGSGNGSSSGSNVTNTGNNVTSNTSSNGTTYTVVDNNNRTVIHQAANVAANTGGNEASGNIVIGGGTAGEIKTGNASTNVSFLVTAGGNVTLVGGNGSNGPGDGAQIILANTGRFARFNTASNKTRYTLVTNENRALLSQACGYPIGQNERLVDMSGCMASTGGNNASYNIAFGGDAGVIKTGNAEVNVSMQADINHNRTGIAGVGSNGGADSDVFNTGDNTQVNTSANSSDTTTVNNRNTARISQNVNAKANTGDNIANGNISFGGRAGIIDTGNATVSVSMLADANSNNTAVGGAGGARTSGDGASATIYNTGDNTTFNTNTNSSNTTTVNNFNLLDLVQGVVSWASTGLNSAIGNIGRSAGIITTSDAAVNINQEVKGGSNCTAVGASQNPCVTPQPTTTQSGPTQTPGGIGGSSNDPATNQGGSVAGSSTTNNPSTQGQVLGEFASILPATGPEYTLTLLLMIVGLFGVGSYLRKMKVS